MRSEGTVVAEAASPAPTTPSDHAWTRLLKVLAGIMTLWAIVLNVLAGEPIPPVIVFGILFLAGIFVMRARPAKGGPIYLLVVSVAVTLVGGPFAIEALPHPESPFDFIFSVIQVLVPFAIIAAAIGALRRWAEVPRRAIAFGALGAFVVLSAVSVVAALGLEDDTAAAFDLRVVAEDVEFQPEALQLQGDVLGVFIDNKDPIRHTFTITELGVDQELPAGTARRIEFQAAPGTYEFFCAVSGHEDMKGTLVIAG